MPPCYGSDETIRQTCSITCGRKFTFRLHCRQLRSYSLCEHFVIRIRIRLYVRISLVVQFLTVHNYQPTWNTVLEKLTVPQLVKKCPDNLCNLKVHYDVHKCQPVVPILSQMNPVHALLHYFFETRFNIILLSIPGSSKWSFSPRFHFSSVCTICPSHLILLDLITQIVSGKEYKSSSSSLCHFPNFPLTSTILGLNIFLPKHPILKHPEHVFFPQCQRPSFTPI